MDLDLLASERSERDAIIVMFMELEIYIYIRTSVSNIHVRMSVLRIKFKS